MLAERPKTKRTDKANSFKFSRREFLKDLALLAAGGALLGCENRNPISPFSMPEANAALAPLVECGEIDFGGGLKGALEAGKIGFITEDNNPYAAMVTLSPGKFWGVGGVDKTEQWGFGTAKLLYSQNGQQSETNLGLALKYNGEKHLVEGVNLLALNKTSSTEDQRVFDLVTVDTQSCTASLSGEKLIVKAGPLPDIALYSKKGLVDLKGPEGGTLQGLLDKFSGFGVAEAKEAEPEVTDTPEPTVTATQTLEPTKTSTPEPSATATERPTPTKENSLYNFEYTTVESLDELKALPLLSEEEIKKVFQGAGFDPDREQEFFGPTSEPRSQEVYCNSIYINGVIVGNPILVKKAFTLFEGKGTFDFGAWFWPFATTTPGGKPVEFIAMTGLNPSTGFEEIDPGNNLYWTSNWLLYTKPGEKEFTNLLNSRLGNTYHFYYHYFTPDFINRLNSERRKGEKVKMGFISNIQDRINVNLFKDILEKGHQISYRPSLKYFFEYFLMEQGYNQSVINLSACYRKGSCDLDSGLVLIPPMFIGDSDMKIH